MLISSVMNIHTTVSRDGCHILVTSSGQTYDNALIRAVILCDLTHLCYRMGTLDGADDSLGSCQIFKSIHCFIIRDGHILRSADVMQISMLRSDAGIIQSCGNGIYGSDLSILILTEIGFHAMEDS